MSGEVVAVILVLAFIASAVFIVLTIVALTKFLFSIRHGDIKNDVKTNLKFLATPVWLLFEKDLGKVQKQYAAQVKFRALITIIFVLIFIYCIELSK